MKASQSTHYVCQSCGNQRSQWLGRCPMCQEWNTLEEEYVAKVSKAAAKSGRSRKRAPQKAVPITKISSEKTQRFVIGIHELDRVLGGGIVPGSVTLLGGEPGSGKSTILQILAYELAKQGKKALYITAEESVSQSRLTAERLGTLHDNLYLMAETDLTAALTECERLKPDVLILDSVQTFSVPEVPSAPGSVTQIREVTSRVVEIAKNENMATFLIGHVTKEGSLAGPKLLEHMVDTVLYFENNRLGTHRILRAHKNRYGSTHEIGVFEMTERGLKEVTNPSEIFLAEKPIGKPGSVVFPTLEGTRPILVEVQALCVQSPYGTPRRITSGVDSTRCAVLAAVMEKEAGLFLGSHDLFLNVAGGTTLSEPAADLSVAIAIASSLLNRPAKEKLIAIGEVGLAGEIRSVQKVETRLIEAARLGFERALVPKRVLKNLNHPKNMNVRGVASLEEAIDLALEEFSQNHESTLKKQKEVHA